MIIDLRSDTVTRPSEGMRRAMAAAEVGDDVYGEDPTVRRLEEHAAAMFGREAGLFVPSGTMANAIWQCVLARPGTEVLCEADAHIANYESGAGVLAARVQYRTVPTADGLLDPTVVAANLRSGAYHLTPTSLVSIEQTHNRHGGRIYPLDVLTAIAELVHASGVRLHIDGARIFNAVVATGTPPDAYGRLADGLSFCLSKGLGAPVGSVLLGDAEAIAEARVWRRRLGGAMRQAGVLAAAGLYALEHHVGRLAEDHANARSIAEIVAEAAPGRCDPSRVETNIVLVDTAPRDALEVAEALRAEGVLVGAVGPHTLRLVTHLDVDAAGCRYAAERLAALLTERAPARS